MGPRKTGRIHHILGPETPLARTARITVKLTPEEHEWLRRKAYWEGVPVSEIVRRHVRELVQDGGYLRPPDDEPQDFGFEKEMIEFVRSVDPN